MSKAELARACDVSGPTVTDWENGNIKNLDASNMLTICKVLRIDPYWLVFGIDKSKAPITDLKDSLSHEASKLISWVERVDRLGGLAPKLLSHINAALQVAGALTQAQNSPRDEDLAGAEEDLTSHIEKSEGKERAHRKHKP
jgi:transcriptional regulator with XRE-family HTH domain